MKLNKIWLTVVAIVLALTMSFSNSLSVIGQCTEANKTIYVKDIKVFNGSLSDAKQRAEAAGYTLYQQNLAPATAGSNNVYIGYMTTNNRNEAITDINVMRMGIGYEQYDYSTVLQWLKGTVNESAGHIMIIASKVTENSIENPDNYLVNHAISVLNSYTVPSFYIPRSEEDQPFGDFLLSDDFNQEFVQNFLVRATSNELSMLLSQLAVGVADVDPDDTWADRVRFSDSFSSQKTAANQTDSFDTNYSAYAKFIAPQITDFCTYYSKAKEYYDKYGSFDNIAANKADKKGKSAAEEYQKKCLEEGGNEEDTYPFYYAAYEKLAEYPVITSYNNRTKTTTVKKNLAEYILELKDADFGDVTNLRRLYPIVEAMTDGQRLITHYVGLLQMVTLLGMDGSDECIENLKTQRENAVNEFKKETGAETVYLFASVKESDFNQKVYVTSETIRTNTASKDYTSFMGKDYTYYDEIQLLTTKLNIASIAIGLADLVSSFIIGAALGSQYVGFSAMFSVWAIQGARLCMQIIGTISSVFTWVSVAVAIACLVYEFIIVADQKESKWREVEEEEADIPYEAPPSMIYSREACSSGGCYVAEYYGVTMYGSSKVADMNCGTGKRWNCLYTTKSSKAGSPICVDDIGNVFTVCKGTAVNVSGYTAVSPMGSTIPANINAYNYSGTTDSKTVNDSTSLFLHFRTEESIEKDNSGSNTNKGTSVNTETYLSDITVAYSNNESSARRELESQGYTVVENDLTPGQYLYYNVNLTKVYTFVGYKTTTDKNDALTDIRVVNSCQDKSISYGNSTYALAGKLHSGDGLFYSKSKSAGTPITGNLYVYSSVKSAPAGYEPVILLSGGPSYNFAKSNTAPESEDGTNYYFSAFSAAKDFKNMTYRYLYFEPSVMYTSGEEYLSGIFAIRSSSPGSTMNSILGADSDWEDYSHHENDTLSFTDFKVYAERCFEGDYKILYDDYNGHICYDTIEHIDEQDDERELYFDSSSVSAFDEYAMLCCSTTHNPYRAVYDIKVYYGDAMLDTLFPSITTANGSYASCEAYGFGTVSYHATWLSEGTALWGQDRVAILPFHSIALTIGSNISQDYEFMDDAKRKSYYVNVANSEEFDQACDYTVNCLRGIYLLGNTLEGDNISNAKPIRYDQLYVTTDSNYNKNHKDYVPVPGFMKPNSCSAVAIDGTIGAGSENYQHYLYVLNDGSGNTDLIAGGEKKYISSIHVGSADTDWSKDMYSLTDASARLGALSGSADEVLCCNFAAEQGQTWYGSGSNIKIKKLKSFGLGRIFDQDDCNYTLMTRDISYCPLADTSAYLGVSRTNSNADAIYDIIAYKPGKDGKYKSTITVNGITYNYSGAVVPDDNGEYAFYYTNTVGAGIGRPITALELSDTPIKKGVGGVICYKTTDTTDKNGNTVFAERTTLSTASVIYLNIYYAGPEEGYPELSFNAYTDLCVGAGDELNGHREQYITQIAQGGLVNDARYKTISAAEATAEILAQGCRFCYSVDLNKNTGSCPIYIGYNGTNYSTALEKGTDMITDILFTVGEPYKKTKKIGDVTYYGCPVSLNAGTIGYQIYMYTTTDKSVGSPIDGFRIYSGDWRPENTSSNVWGEVLDIYGFRANLNDGVARVGQGDSRLHMYVSRHDNTIKRGTAPTGGVYGITDYGHMEYN